VPFPLLPSPFAVATTVVIMTRPPVIDFEVPVQVDRITQGEVDRAMRGSIRGRQSTLSWTPGVQLTGPNPRIADTPLSEVVQYIDGVRVSAY
jgi:hypothetical protein